MSCICQKYTAIPKTLTEVQDRMSHEREFRKDLEVVASFDWRSVLKCKLCGALWAEESPYSEIQGGGPSCFYIIETDDPQNWLETMPQMTIEIRKKAEPWRFKQ